MRERMVEKVATRFLQRVADSYGDPDELLRAYRAELAEYAAHEETATKYIQAYREIERLEAEGPHTKAERTALYETHMIERMTATSSKDKADGPSDAVLYNGRSGKLGKVANKLSLSILQHLVLPAGLRRSVEASAKWWNQTFRPPKGNTFEETRALRVELYLNHLAAFRKYEKIYEDAIRVGKPHSAEGEGATRLAAGPFTVVNTGGFTSDKMEDCAKAVLESAHKMASIGLGKVCYGDVLMSNRLMGKNVAAFYSPPQDELFVRADISKDMNTVRYICHELTHRLVSKFLGGRMADIQRLYAQLDTAASMTDVDFPPLGEEVEYKGKNYKVTDYDTRRKAVLVTEEDPKALLIQRESYWMPVDTYQKLQGRAVKKSPLHFVTPYAKKGGPEENFCEMVSFYALGKLPQDQVDLLLPIIE